MKLLLIKYVTLLLTLVFSSLAMSQTKKEKEERVKRSHFPENAIEIIETLPKKCKRLKFYKETDGEKQSFELKFKYKGDYYSLEFFKNGTIEDIEVITKLRKINKKQKESLAKYFEDNFKKYNIIKIQKQYIYSPEKTPSSFIDHVLTKQTNFSPNFEIIAEVKTDDTREIREFTFNNLGKFSKFRALSPTSYEHVLY